LRGFRVWFRVRACHHLRALLFRVKDAAFRVWALGFKVWFGVGHVITRGLFYFGLRMQGLGFRVWAFGFGDRV
jgi:hypothetical protein